MKDSTLRIALFVVIIIFGSLMILFDIPVFYLLIGAVVLGVLVLFLTGTVRLPSWKRKKADPRKEVTKKAEEKKPQKGKKEKSPGQKSGSGEFFSSLKGAFSVLGRDLRRGKKSKKDLETHQKKIDTLLDRSIQGEAVASLDDIIPDAVPAEKKKTSDPFSALVGEDLNSDLLNGIQGAEDFSILDDSELGMESEISDQALPAPGGEIGNLDISLSGDETPIALDETNDADEVKEILAAHKGELDLDQEAGMNLAEDVMEGLDGLDLDGIDLGETEESRDASAGGPKSAPIPGGKAVQVPGGPAPGKSEPPKPAAPAFSPEPDMLSFSRGRGQDDDLMASLRSDAKSSKKSEYASLIRDLKDTRVEASDLQSELEGLLKPKRPKTE
ncbi:MAG: hypothetical protein MUC66_07555 [Methanolinea sp.]|jgi:hypothetical protein|nr:hypothetical protein [Methanolinea sp.]